MSGHSKWSTIKRKKGAKDAARGKVFTKLNKEITVAVKEGGGGEPDTNPRLRLAIQNAKGANMPKDNIDRAIKKAEGADGATYIEVNYEGYGVNGIAVFVECMTDNLNRTVSDVRAIFSKQGGSLAINGSVDYLFDRLGVFNINKSEDLDAEELELELIDAGADDIEIEGEIVVVTCPMESFGEMQKKIESLKLEVEVAELQRIPQSTTEIDDDAFAKVMKLIDALEDNDDVQNVYHNMAISDAQMDLI